MGCILRAAHLIILNALLFLVMVWVFIRASFVLIQFDVRQRRTLIRGLKEKMGKSYSYNALEGMLPLVVKNIRDETVLNTTLVFEFFSLKQLPEIKKKLIHSCKKN